MFFFSFFLQMARAERAVYEGSGLIDPRLNSGLCFGDVAGSMIPKTETAGRKHPNRSIRKQSIVCCCRPTRWKMKLGVAIDGRLLARVDVRLNHRHSPTILC
eukprot:c1559_g1_i2.p1 GENE.c1559_g1_i2~~c1559_g1_i2.p1  ORF type:complete len:102 (-),score=7.66 c1559_g1_i2:60-365(-)